MSAALKALQAKGRACYFNASEKTSAIGKHLPAVVRAKYLYPNPVFVVMKCIVVHVCACMSLLVQ